MSSGGKNICRPTAEAGCSFFRALSSHPWPGIANLEIASVWLRKGLWAGEYLLDGKPVAGISSYLSLHGLTIGSPLRLSANESKAFQGSIICGMGFVLSHDEAQALIVKDRRNKSVLFPYINGDDLNSRPDQSPSRWVINFFDWPIERAMEFPDCFGIVEAKVKPERTRKKAGKEDFALRNPLPQKWWIYADKRPRLYQTIAGLSRVLVCAEVSKFICFAFRPVGEVFPHMLNVFPSDADCDFCILQSTVHEVWCREHGSTLETRFRYAPSDCLETFPFPNRSNSLAEAGGTYDTTRRHIMDSCQEGLTKTYNRFHNPDNIEDEIQTLRILHIEMDRAVTTAYGWSDLNLNHGFHETKQGIRFTISEPARREVLQRLLKLNHERYAEEVVAGLDKKKPVKAASKPKPTKTKSAPTLFELDTAFPVSARDKVLCGLFCDLVASEPSVRFDAYADALMIAVRPQIYEGLLPKEERKAFTKAVRSLKVTDKASASLLPWHDLKETLLGSDAIQVDAGTSYVRGSRFDEVRPDYPKCDPKVVELILKVANTLREYQDLGQNAPAQEQQIVSKHTEAKRTQSGVTP